MTGPSLLRAAFRLTTLRRILRQVGLALLVFLLAAVWLRVPDASAIDVIGSGLLGLLILAIAGAGQAGLLIELCGRRRTWSKLLLGGLLILSAIALWIVLSGLITRGQTRDYEFAGFLNSRFPHGMRRWFTFERIALWLGWGWSLLAWIVGGIFARVAFALTVSKHPYRAILRTLRSFVYWAALIAGTGLASALTGTLVAWTPGHGLGVETLSLVLRLAVVVLFDAAIVCFLLALLAACILRSDATYDTPAGTPDDSQPRTAEAP